MNLEEAGSGILLVEGIRKLVQGVVADELKRSIAATLHDQARSECRQYLDDCLPDYIRDYLDGHFDGYFNDAIQGSDLATTADVEVMVDDCIGSADLVRAADFDRHLSLWLSSVNLTLG